jgi:hypothetical protein
MRAFTADLKRRPPTEWGIRLVLAAVIAAVGYIAVVQSWAEALPDRDAAMAHRLAPNNARITAKLSRLLILEDPNLAHRAEEKQLALDALRGDATAVSAVTTLGLLAQVDGNDAAARRLFAYSEWLSRRDLVSRLWMIEDAVTRNNTAEALRQYDLALRTDRAASGVLFPVLASASNDPSIAAALLKTLAAQPAWTDSFITFAAGNSGDPEATARLFVALRQKGVPVSPDAQSTLVDALIAGNRFDAAWTYYASARPGAGRSHSRDTKFTMMNELPAKFDWNATSSGSGLSATLQPAAGGGLFDFAAPSGLGGQLLQQMQVLPAGRYILEGHSIGVEQRASSRPYWVLTCTSGRELGRVDMPNSTEKDGHFAGSFTVPAGCPVQTLALVARATDAVSGLAGQVDYVQLRPAN